MTTTRWRQVEEQLEGAVGRVFPSAQLIVIEKNQPVFSACVGECDNNSQFDLASLTKPLCTSLLIMMLLEEGKIALHSEVRPGVTVFHLLCHASGLPAHRRYDQLVEVLDGEIASPDQLDPAAVIVAAALQEPLDSVPGTKSVYSDIGFILLGDFLEKVAEQRLSQLFQERVAEPLGNAVQFGPMPAYRCVPTEGYRGIVHDENARAMGGVAGHAGLFGSAVDVARIVQYLLQTYQHASKEKGDLVEPAVLRQFWSPCGVPDSTWCLGWDRPSRVNSSAGTQWSRDGVGHLAFTGCSLWLDPELGRAVILLSNRVEPTRENREIVAFRPLIHDAIFTALASDS